jgi:hypothetical protein
MRGFRTLVTPLLWLAWGIALCSISAPARAVTLGQIDDFEDGTTQNWSVGFPHPAPPQNIPGGGPGGADDSWMLLTSTGGDGPGSRLAVMNDAQWAGDYPSAGIGAIGMHLHNLSMSDLHIRLLFEDAGGGPPLDLAITRDVLLPAGSDWTYGVFPIDPSDLIVLQGDVDFLMAHVTEIRIFHNPDADFPPPPITAQLGVDNVEAMSGATPAAETSWGRVKRLYTSRQVL